MGRLHRERLDIEDLERLRDTSTLPAAQALEPRSLTGLVSGRRGIVPAGTKRVVRIGPGVAPVVIAEDRGAEYVPTASAVQTLSLIHI